MNRLLPILLLLFSCTKEAPIETISFPVTVTKSVKKDLPLYLDSIGHVEAIIAVAISPRVDGQIMKIHFTQGDEVKKGDPLITIDPRPYEAELKKNEGALEENIANLALAKDTLTRNSKLIVDDYISKLNYEEFQANVAIYEALIKQNRADVEKSKLDVEYCHITSPIDGITGILNKDLGNMVFAAEGMNLVQVNQIDPIYVIFSLPEIDFAKINSKNEPLDLTVAIENIKNPLAHGKLNLIDNQIDQETGTIKLRGIFDNKERKLWPGQFVKTRLNIGSAKDVIAIPYLAIQFTSEGAIIYVIKEDKTVEKRIVTLGVKEEEEVEILQGLKEGETVVTRGQLNLFPGASIYISENR